MVKHVEHYHPELYVSSLREVSPLRETEISLGEAWTKHGVHREVAKRAKYRLDKQTFFMRKGAANGPLPFEKNLRITYQFTPRLKLICRSIPVVLVILPKLDDSSKTFPLYTKLGWFATLNIITRNSTLPRSEK